MLYDSYKGKDVNIYTIGNSNLEVDIIDMGARINAIRVFNKDVILGFSTIEDYLDSNSYAKATISRVANRIKDGSFSLNGQIYNLYQNDGKNHLHGGLYGFDKRIFSLVEKTENSLILKYVAKDLEENYPGNLELYVKFIVNDLTLDIIYKAKSDKDTLFSPTNHMYFNLDGEDSDNILEHILLINADTYTPTKLDLIPTGEIKKVENTPFDFRKGKKIGKDFNDPLLKNTNGYDHNYILNNTYAAKLKSNKTDLSMILVTNMPCLQLYTAGALKTSVGKSHVYGIWSGVCLEIQFCPNAINMNYVTKPILKRNETKTYTISYNFNKE